MSIGNECFKYQDVLNLTGLHSLESVSIGEASFTKQSGWYGNDANRKLYVKNCDRLKELRIKGSFTDYTVIEIENVDSLEVIELGELYRNSYNFYFASLELRSDYDGMTLMNRPTKFEITSLWQICVPEVFSCSV